MTNSEMAVDKKPAGLQKPLFGYLLAGAIGIFIWWLLYGQLAWIAATLTYSLLGIDRGTHLGAAVEFFLYDTPKVMMLLVLVVFLMWSLIAFWHQTTQIICYKLEQICISVAIEIMKRRFGLLSRWQLRNSPGKLKCCRKSNDLSTNH